MIDRPPGPALDGDTESRIAGIAHDSVTQAAG